MNQKYIFIVVALGILALGAFGYVSITQKQDSPVQEFVPVEEVVDEDIQDSEERPAEAESIEDIQEDTLKEEVIQTPQELVLPENPTLEQRFEYTLNIMLRDVAVKAGEYKKQRKVLNELTKPENLGDKVYVEENFELFQKTASDLNRRANDILVIFESADEDIKTLASKYDEEGRQAVIDKWNNLKTEQAGAYQEFFSIEDEVIQAHERLMRFYFVKRDYYTVNPDTGAIIFEKESDQRLADTLRLQLNRLGRTQDRALKKQGN